MRAVFLFFIVNFVSGWSAIPRRYRAYSNLYCSICAHAILTIQGRIGKYRNRDPLIIQRRLVPFHKTESVVIEALEDLCPFFRGYSSPINETERALQHRLIIDDSFRLKGMQYSSHDGDTLLLTGDAKNLLRSMCNDFEERFEDDLASTFMDGRESDSYSFCKHKVSGECADLKLITGSNVYITRTPDKEQDDAMLQLIKEMKEKTARPMVKRRKKAVTEETMEILKLFPPDTPAEAIAHLGEDSEIVVKLREVMIIKDSLANEQDDSDKQPMNSSQSRPEATHDEEELTLEERVQRIRNRKRKEEL